MAPASRPTSCGLDAVLGALGPVLADPSILKIGHDVKQASKLLARQGVPLAPADDAMLLSYAVESGLGGHGLTELSERHLGHRPPAVAELTGSGKAAITFDRVPLDRAAPFAAEQADLAHRLWAVLGPRLARDRLAAVYHTLERPLVPVLAGMERAGVRIDRDMLRRFSSRFAQKMAELEDDIYRLAGRRFHIGSPKQLGEILFDEMGLAGGKKTKTGAWGTPADQLEELAAEGHDLPARVLDWRQLSKLKSTYTDALPTYIHPRDGARPHDLRARRDLDRAACRRTTRTCRTSRSAPRKAAPSAPPSSPRRATCWSASTTARSSSASWPTSPTSPR